jgi:hypothetical protein
MAALQQLTNWNLKHPDRIPRYNPNYRWGAYPLVPRGAQSNQYNQPDIELYMNKTYKWLIKNTQEVVNETGHFACWVPPNGNGISTLASGYKHLNWLSNKLTCHQFVWLYYSPGEQIDQDISHLCDNASCCRLDHLYL